MMRTLKDVEDLQSELGADVEIRWVLGRWMCSIRKINTDESVILSKYASGTRLEDTIARLAKTAREAMQ